jgi:membrane-associated phospholipid phosphatase
LVERVDRAVADTPEPDPRWFGIDLRYVRWVAVGLWFGALVISTVIWGVPIDRFAIIFWSLIGLLAASLGKRPAWTVLFDWLPFWILLIVYDLTRGLADTLGSPTWWTPQIRAEKFLFGGVEPTIWLQGHLKEPTAPWWEVLVSTTYVSYFLLPFLIAGLLWVRSRSLFHRFAARYVLINLAALIMFIAIPAAPPWAAARCDAVQVADHPSDPACMNEFPTDPGNGLLGPIDIQHPGASGYVERIATRGFESKGFKIAADAVNEGQAGANAVAAFPSLHAGLSMLLAVFIWPLARRRWRPLIALYPLVMAFSLVYSAEHYVVDILGGWAITALVCGGLAWHERRHERKRLAAADRLDEPVLT